MNHRACCFISCSSTTWDCTNWNLRSSKKWCSSHGFSRSNCGDPQSPCIGIGGTTGCNIVLFGRIIVREFVGKIGRVGDGNGVDGNDGSDGNGVILEVAHVGVSVKT